MVFYPSLVAETGDHAAAAVLSQIFAWHQGERVCRFGAQWIVKSRAQLCADTGITLDQYKRILPRLIQKQLLISERHLFQNKVTPHLRLTPRGESLCLATIPLVSHATKLSTYNIDSSTTEVSTPVMASGASTASSVEPETTGSTGVDTGGVGDLKSQTYLGVVSEHKSQPPKGWFFMKAADVLKAQEASKTGSLGAYWQSRCHLVSDQYQHPLTAKQQGQLKQLFKYLGPQTKPVIAYAVEHWWKFASHAGAAAGCSHPAEPHIGFLLKHHAVAVNLLTKPSPPPSVPEPGLPNPLHSIAGGAETPPSYVPSSQELTELLDGLKAP